MGFAIWFTGLRGKPTEPEIICGRITDWPFAGLFGQFHQADTFGPFFDFTDFGQGLW